MITLANVKTILGIGTTDYDVLIALLIPYVYADICSICNNLFAVDEFEIESDEIYFDDTANVYTINLAAGGFTAIGFPTGCNLVVSGSRLNDGIYTLASQSDTKLTITELLLDEVQTTAGYSVKVSLAIFPKPVDLVAARMIGYLIDSANSAGITSQSIGNYSESRTVLQAQYPDELINGLRTWRNLRLGYGSIRYHVNENRLWFGTWKPTTPEVGYGD